MRVTRWPVVPVVLAVVMGAAGCRGGSADQTVTPVVVPSTAASEVSPSATQSVSPSVSASASASSSPTGIPTATGSQSPNSPALVKEAEAVYRAYFAEINKLEATGGAEKLPPTMRRLTMDPEFKELESLYREALRSGERAQGVERARLVIAGPGDVSVFPDAVVALRACVDASKVTVVARDGSKMTGATYAQTVWLKRDTDNHLKIAYAQVQRGVKC